MTNEISKILKSIEKSKDIRILYACETGSRAWGFPSPDSDYDIRFIYMHKRDWYLSLSQRKDTIEVMEGDLDITGWDLRKSLVLLKRSNAALIERFQSPMVYYAEQGFRDEFKKLIVDYYSPTGVFYHHYSLAKRIWEELKDQQEIKLKSYFYLVRSLLSCYWITRDRSVLPMHIEGLMTKLDTDQTEKLRALIKIKAGVNEDYLHSADKDMNAWIAAMFGEIEKQKEGLGVSGEDFSLLNNFFLKMVNDYADDRTSKR